MCTAPCSSGGPGPRLVPRNGSFLQSQAELGMMCHPAQPFWSSDCALGFLQ